MTWAVGALIVFGASAVMIVAILLVRRRAPEGAYFNDGDRASGVFGGSRRDSRCCSGS